MTEKQKRFVEAYIENPNAAEAARKAGYSPKTADVIGRENLRKPTIAAALSESRQQLAERAQLSAEYVLDGLKEVAERCLQRKPVMVYDKEEKEYVQAADPDTGEGIWTFQAMGANKALELLGKHLGMFVDQLKGDVALTVLFGGEDRLQDEES
jgi:phage terminase small subunit